MILATIGLVLVLMFAYRFREQIVFFWYSLHAMLGFFMLAVTIIVFAPPIFLVIWFIYHMFIAS